MSQFREALSDICIGSRIVSDADNAGETQPTSVDPQDAALRTLRSEDLLRGAREVLIEHGKETYRLRLTKAGKLILNK